MVCNVCAHSKQRLDKESSLQARQTARGRLDPTWCRFEVRNKFMSASQLQQRRMQEAHHMAMDMQLCLDTPVSDLLPERRPVQADDLLNKARCHNLQAGREPGDI